MCIFLNLIVTHYIFCLVSTLTKPTHFFKHLPHSCSKHDYFHLNPGGVRGLLGDTLFNIRLLLTKVIKLHPYIYGGIYFIGCCCIYIYMEKNRCITHYTTITTKTL